MAFEGSLMETETEVAINTNYKPQISIIDAYRHYKSTILALYSHKACLNAIQCFEIQSN